jgi:hypothetical protein
MVLTWSAAEDLLLHVWTSMAQYMCICVCDDDADDVFLTSIADIATCW